MVVVLSLGVLAIMLGIGTLLASTVSPEDAPYDTGQRIEATRQEIRQTNAAGADDSADIYYVVEPSGNTPPSTPTPWTEDINNVDHRLPVDAPSRSSLGARDRESYDNVVDQFVVEENPRYKARDDIPISNDADTQACAVEFVGSGTSACLPPSFTTYCHTFVWDVTRAMGVELPYWVDENGDPNGLVLTEQGWEIWFPAYWMSANAINQWLNRKGPESGWREVSAAKAQELANLGHPTVVSVYELQGFGHVGIVRPGERLNGPALAQAGTSNANYAYVYDFFPRKDTQFFVHD